MSGPDLANSPFTYWLALCAGELAQGIMEGALVGSM